MDGRRYGRRNSLGRGALLAHRGAGVSASLSIPFYAASQAPGVASGGARGRALRALKQKTGPSGAYGFPPLRVGTFRFSACPALSPVCFLGPATAAPKGMDRLGQSIASTGQW